MNQDIDAAPLERRVRLFVEGDRVQYNGKLATVIEGQTTKQSYIRIVVDGNSEIVVKRTEIKRMQFFPALAM